MAHTLVNFIGYRLPFLVDCARRTTDGKPALIDWLEPIADGWRVSLRGRVVSLLADKSGYWSRFGLPGPADYRTMALCSLLASNGNLSGRITNTVASPRGRGASIAEAIEAETDAIRAAANNLRKLEEREAQKRRNRTGE